MKKKNPFGLLYLMSVQCFFIIIIFICFEQYLNYVVRH